MIRAWLKKKILLTADPERVLVFCALYGAVDTLGVPGALLIFWKVFQKRKKERKHANTKQKKEVR